MSILSVTCPCGKILRAEQQHLGKTAVCPECGARVKLVDRPSEITEFEPIPVAVPESPRRARPHRSVPIVPIAITGMILGAFSIAWFTYGFLRDRTDPAPRLTASARREPRAPFPDHVVKVDLEGKNFPEIGLQTRFFRGYTRGPIDAESARETLRMIYEHLKADIETTQPDAKDKLIHIILGTCELEVVEGMSFASCETKRSTTVLPEWPDLPIRVDHRDLGTRPDAYSEMLYLAHMRTLRETEQTVKSRFLDADGFLRIPKDQFLELEQDVDEAQEQALVRLAEKLKISRQEIDRNSWRWLIWTSGLAATDEAIDKATNDE
jgi:DNA-directed RNA polymerase subunit RPC12/RpoP